MEHPQVIVTILVFGIVQSILGMGLLVFGTPTLLLLGFPFIKVLTLLLPASVAISFAQVLMTRMPPRRFCIDFGIFCLPVVVIALGAITVWGGNLQLDLLIAAILLVSVALNFFPEAKSKLEESQRKSYHLTLVVMGLVHGLSNIGGSVLSILARSQSSDKRVIRSYVSFCYLAFGIMQLATLFAFGAVELSFFMIISATLAATVFLITEWQIFKTLTDQTFQRIINFFMFSYAVILIARQLTM